MIKIKRSYEPAEDEDGFRILVDKLWPRGVSKDRVNLDLWMKEIAPSDDLRRWFSHDPEKWEEFKARYKAELEDKKELLREIKNIEKENNMVTMIYSAKDTEHNNALVLVEMLNQL